MVAGLINQLQKGISLGDLPTRATSDRDDPSRRIPLDFHMRYVNESNRYGILPVLLAHEPAPDMKIGKIELY